MKVFAVLISLISLLFNFTRLNAQTQLTLNDAIKIGLEKNYRVLISDLNLDIAQNNNTWGAAGLWPSINAGLNINNSYENITNYDYSGRQKGTRHVLTPNVNLQWVLFNGMAVYRTKENLEYYEGLAGESKTGDIENTIRNIILAYYGALLEKEKLAVTKELMELSYDRYKYFLTKQELGNALTFDVLQVKTAYLNDSSTYLLQRINYKNSLRNLNLLLAQKAEVEYDPSDEFEASFYSYAIEELKTELEKNNSTLKTLNLNQKVLENNIALARSAVYPIFSLNSGYNYNQSYLLPDGIEAFSTYAYTYYANLTLSINLYNGLNTQRAIENARMEEEIGKLQLKETEHTLTNLLSNFYELYEIRKQQFDVSKENLKSAKLNLQIARDKFETGAINSFNYRDIQIAYLNASFQMLQAKYNLIDTNTELLRMTGRIIKKYQ